MEKPASPPKLEAPEFIAPMQALGVGAVPRAEPGAWHCEIKFDGYRAIAVLRGGAVRLWSRNHRPLAYPEILPGLAALPCSDAVLDGEIVALDSLGRSSFQALQGRDRGERPPIVYFVFDLLRLNGRPLLAEPIEARRAALTRLLKKPGRFVQLSRWFEVEPGTLLAETRRNGLEGVVLKRRGSPYEPDRRSGAWLKVKNLNEQEFVIGGFTAPKHSRQHFGALLVGYHAGGNLVYAGKVGTGFDTGLLHSLHARFLGLKRRSCPFARRQSEGPSGIGPGVSPSVMRSATWLQPRLVAQVKFAEWTQDGLLRQPVFLGLRRDKTAQSVRRERAAARPARRSG